jgi:hypothetical protein
MHISQKFRDFGFCGRDGTSLSISNVNSVVMFSLKKSKVSSVEDSLLGYISQGTLHVIAVFYRHF